MKSIICIGREYGSGGREIGEGLAQALEIPCYDKLLIKKAALASGLSEEFISKAEDSPIGSFQFISGNVCADIASIGGAFYSGGQAAYDAERSVIEQLTRQEPCVIIGRCASSIIPKEQRLSVFIYANKNDAVNRIMRRNGIGEKDAAHRIRHMNRMRRQYFDFYSDTEWGRPESYDAMLSSSRFGIEGCIKIIRDILAEQEEPGNE